MAQSMIRRLRHFYCMAKLKIIDCGGLDEIEETLDAFAELGERFHGVDISFRRGGTDWPKRWRARSVSTKHENVTVYGDDILEAIKELLKTRE